MFLYNLAIKLLENIIINKYAIKLSKDKQPPYKLIYNKEQVEWEILKTFIGTYLKTGFI